MRSFVHSDRQFCGQQRTLCTIVTFHHQGVVHDPSLGHGFESDKNCLIDRVMQRGLDAPYKCSNLTGTDVGKKGVREEEEVEEATLKHHVSHESQQSASASRLAEKPTGSKPHSQSASPQLSWQGFVYSALFAILGVRSLRCGSEFESARSRSRNHFYPPQRHVCAAVASPSYHWPLGCSHTISLVESSATI